MDGKPSRLTIKGNHLLFFDNKDLIVEINEIKLGGMNVTAPILGTAFILFYLAFRFISGPRNNFARRIRIKNASLIFQAITWVSLVFGVYWFLAFLFGWPFPIGDKLRVVISQHHIYESPGEMPTTILAWWIVKICLGLFCAGVLIRLFRLYARGTLFSAKNVTCIRFLGWWLIIDWLIDYQMQGLLKDMALSSTPVFIGFLIIFIAWIMDEGRKIQEEQELTV